MKFRVVENTIKEGSYGVEIGHKEPEIRGEKSLREFICDLLSRVCEHYLDANYFILHRKNGNHHQHSVDNVVLLPTYVKSDKESKIEGRDNINYNTSLDNMKRTGTITFNMNDERYLEVLALMDAVDVEKSLYSGKISNVYGIDIWDKLNKR